MSVSAGVAYIDIVPDTSKMGKTLSTAVTKQSTGLKGTFSKLGGGLGGALAGGFAAFGAVNVLKDAIGEAEEAQKVGAQTAAVLESTGNAAGVSADHVSDLAGSLSDIAAVDDEVIQQGENVLLTFTNVRNEVGKGNDIFDQATGLALDMSSALGTDLQGSVIQLGKALNDPIKGITALSRVGVSFTEEQKDQIKVLIDSGDQLGAQKVILGELRKEFGGTAKANATSSDHMKVAFGNLEESLGQALIPVLQTLSDILVPITKAFIDLPEPVRTTFIAVGLAAGAFKLFGGHLFRTLGSLGRLIGILPKVAVRAGTAAVATEGLGVAEGFTAVAAGDMAVAEGTAAVATRGLGARALAAGPLLITLAAATYDVIGAMKIFNAQQDTNKANASARHQQYSQWANDLGLSAIKTGHLTKSQTLLIQKMEALQGTIAETKGDSARLAEAQDVLDRRVQEGRISFGTYSRIIHETGLKMDVTGAQAADTSDNVKALGTRLGTVAAQTRGAAADFDRYRRVVDRHGQSLASLPKNVNTDYTLTYHYQTVGAPPPGTPAGMHAPQIAAASGWHGWTNGPTSFLAGERPGQPRERVDIGGGGKGAGQIVVRNTLKVDRRHFLDGQDYELRFGGPG